MRPSHKQIVILVSLIVLEITCGVLLFSYQFSDNTVAPQIEGEQEPTDRVPLTATATVEPPKDFSGANPR